MATCFSHTRTRAHELINDIYGIPSVPGETKYSQAWFDGTIRALSSGWAEGVNSFHNSAHKSQARCKDRHMLVRTGRFSLDTRCLNKCVYLRSCARLWTVVGIWQLLFAMKRFTVLHFNDRRRNGRPFVSIAPTDGWLAAFAASLENA